MKDLGTTLLRPEAFSEIVIGNTAVVRAMLESGVRSVSAYPGSPTPEIAEAIGAIPAEQRPFCFEFSVNEKVATEVAFGAALNGRLSVVFFKSVGLNVAADSFVQLPLMDIPGGLVVVLGDDPGANSSQNEQDNRHYARMSYMPLLRAGLGPGSLRYVQERRRPGRPAPHGGHPPSDHPRLPRQGKGRLRRLEAPSDRSAGCRAGSTPSGTTTSRSPPPSFP